MKALAFISHINVYFISRKEGKMEGKEEKKKRRAFLLSNYCNFLEISTFPSSMGPDTGICENSALIPSLQML